MADLAASRVVNVLRERRLPIERLSALSSGARYVPGTCGPECPYCAHRGTVVRGNRVYVCMNPDCRGMAGEAGDAPNRWASRLVVSGGHAYLEPWHSATLIDEQRARDPRSMVAPYLRAKEAMR